MDLKKIYEAQENLKGIINETPLLKSNQLSKISNNTVYLKGEHLQKSGSFKIRGAYNAVKSAKEKDVKLVVAASSGNHGQAVALAAKILGIKAIIVVPTNVAKCKQAAIIGYGGEIEYCGVTSAERIPYAIKIAEEKTGKFIPPYDDELIIAGQGTVGLEIIDSLPEVEAIIVPIGGGGLISGLLTSIKALRPEVKVIGVEPELANDTYLSLKANKHIQVDATKTIADGLRTTEPGKMTFPILQKHLDEIVLVSESEVKEAFKFVLERTKQYIEPSSATTVAAVMNQKINITNKNVVCLISGGNLDLTEINNLL